MATRVAGKSSKLEEEIFLVRNDRTFGLTESEIVLDVQNGVRELLDIENRLKPEVPEVPDAAEKPEPILSKPADAVPKFKIKLKN